MEDYGRESSPEFVLLILFFGCGFSVRKEILQRPAHCWMSLAVLTERITSFLFWPVARRFGAFGATPPLSGVPEKQLQVGYNWLLAIS